MSNKRDSKKSRIEAVVIALLFIGTALIVSVNTIATEPTKQPDNKRMVHKRIITLKRAMDLLF